MLASNKILFQLTGSIACFKACELISQLVKAGYEVQTVASANALKFVGTSTLEALTHKPVLSDIFAEGHALTHINAAREADLHLICPASANTINKLAHGIADNLIGNLFLANNFQKPVWLVPAMNTQMLEHPATQQSLSTLSNWGVRVFATQEGKLACGESGAGRILEPAELFKEIELFFQQVQTSSTPAKKVLITAGGTSEPIDGVRSITNMSTGKTGAFIADAFLSKGWEVSFVHASTSHQPKNRMQQHVPFTTYEDLEQTLKNSLQQHFDAVIHLAAVSDYTLSHITDEKNQRLETSKKIDSKGNINLHLKPRPKILNQLKTFSLNKKIQVVGFKLTSGASEEERAQKVSGLFEDGQVDLVVHNDLREIDHSKNLHITRIYRKNGLLQEVKTSQALADALEKQLREQV